MTCGKQSACIGLNSAITYHRPMRTVWHM